ncbi:single-stranded DNA-binding protein [Acaricomes phytoseiuli]|uniref:single-stranded DNA-binding protein n=1 Tax=Acaricomes phytoseiuli TaxID=291968 RepID=UPI002221BB5D|nr:single-stranded DNA-binding protein [Acaricomes phytoseiuli]MCW1249644.1 single-stranded DNA-binding protein [Acaricomes phytoseiuli]
MTVVGNLTKDPELRYTKNGAPVAEFNVASTPRTFDKQAGDWKDGETVFTRVTAWQQLAENAAESLSKGSRVVVTGVLEASKYTDKDGQERTSQKLRADEIGASVRFATVQITKGQAKMAQSPWTPPAQGTQETVWGDDNNDAPPF